ncbi:1-acyl-sn-glycerol-3-phosphate acyltransferase [Alienimonas californiensis]|uniref:Acyltransferase n=1 Tax=Alienimonas californiensis TaxID=2527989 RepID=A0A517PFA9_9PLAN|nr:1-acyl-sn-glycerol-3-phosphate acyltransferase [Alienimonas californiensis]QDT18049.1 Acyltransferase [Alienimonas californiensis]
MQKLIVEEPYEFIPPYRGTMWVKFFDPFLPTFLRRSYGIADVQVTGGEALQENVKRGAGVLLTPNHVRLSDPMTLGVMQTHLGLPTFSMASWHLFRQDGFGGRVNAWMMRNLGAFSVFREGNDRAALSCAMDILVSGERPLVLFPEGVVSQTNDRPGPLLEGTAVIARSAAKRRAKQAEKEGRADTDAGVVIHPIGLRYEFLDDPEAAAEPVVRRLEERFGKWPDPRMPMIDRVRALGEALLALREVQFAGGASSGDQTERAAALIEAILNPIERREGLSSDGSTITRVKALRAALLPSLVSTETPAEEKERMRRELYAAFFAQQVHFLYPAGYLTEDAPPERMLETLERIDEDLNDSAQILGRWRVRVNVGPAIPVEGARPRGGTDPLLGEVEAGIYRELGLPLPQTADVAPGVPAIAEN